MIDQSMAVKNIAGDELDKIMTDEKNIDDIAQAIDDIVAEDKSEQNKTENTEDKKKTTRKKAK